MTAPAPPHPSTIRQIPMTHRAEIRTHDGRWFRYAVHRSVGIANPENSVSMHRSLKGARRAAERWTHKRSDSEVIETHTEDVGIAP